MKKLAVFALLFSIAALADTSGYLDVGQNATLFQGVPLSLTAPSDGQCYVFSAAQDEWIPNSCGGGGGGGATGPTGARGATGASGTNGTNGATGATGAIGSVGTFSNTSTANGLDVTGSVLTQHAADGTNPGALTAIAQTIAGAKTFLATLFLSNGTVAAPSTGFANSTTTGVYAATGGVIDMAFAGTGPTEFGADYLQIGKAAAGSPAGGTGTITVYETGSTTNNWQMGAGTGSNLGSSRVFVIGSNGIGGAFGINANNNGSMFFNAAGVQSVAFFNYDFISRSTLTTPNFTGANGSSVNQAVLTVRNEGTATNGNFGGLINAGDSNQGNGGIFFFNDANPANTGTEQSHIELWNALAGVVAPKVKFRPNGNIEFGGTVPTVSACGTSPSVVGNNTAGTITIGTGGTATSCLLTFATTPVFTNIPHCFVNDQSAIISVQAVPTTTTVTFNATLAFAASTLLDYHCVGHF